MLLDVRHAVLLVADPLHRVLAAETLHQGHRRSAERFRTLVDCYLTADCLVDCSNFSPSRLRLLTC